MKFRFTLYIELDADNLEIALDKVKKMETKPMDFLNVGNFNIEVDRGD